MTVNTPDWSRQELDRLMEELSDAASSRNIRKMEQLAERISQLQRNLEAAS